MGKVSEESRRFVQDCENGLGMQFLRIEEVELHNCDKVLGAMQAERISQRHFAPSTGYGYDDIGRDALGRIFAQVMGGEAALVRPQFASGTHAIATALFGLLMPGDTMLCASGTPYDTLRPALGIEGEEWGSLRRYGVSYREIPLREGAIDIPAILAYLRSDSSVTLLYFQRSRGYAWRTALGIEKIGEAIRAVKAVFPEICVVVDNCYGEFVERREPCDVGADVSVGSLIKNPGGGLAPTGAYIAGGGKYIDRIAARMTSPGIGGEVGSYAAVYTPFFQGLFMAPHVVAEALKGAVLAARCLERLGYETSPAWDGERADIIQAVQFGREDALIAFCRSVQAVAPVDSHLLPEPWDMPGYQEPVIMAAGSFVQGASIELSADGPVKPPYIAYMQGGLYYAHVKLAIARVVEALQAGDGRS